MTVPRELTIAQLRKDFDASGLALMGPFEVGSLLREAERLEEHNKSLAADNARLRRKIRAITEALNADHSAERP